MRRTGPLVLVAVVVVIAAGVVVLSGGKLPWLDALLPSDSPKPDPCPIPKTVATDPMPAAPGLQVVDKGFTQADNGQLSVGVVVANTTDKVAYRTRLTYQLFDDTHTQIAKTGIVEAVVPILLPGQQVGLGFSKVQRDPRAASVEVHLGSTTWLPELGGFTPVTATFTRIRQVTPDSPVLIVVEYHEKSANCRPLAAGKTGVVFRDANGHIVGGDLADSTVGIAVHDGPSGTASYEQPAGAPHCSPGEGDTWVVPTTGRVPAMADARTEIYPFCDVQAP